MVLYGMYDPLLTRVIPEVILNVGLTFQESFGVILNVCLKYFLMESIVYLSRL